MATWIDGRELNPEILNALVEWRDNCLLNDGGVFTENNLWTKDNFSALEKLFVDNSIDGKDFHEKLKFHLKGVPVGVIQLASELQWLVLFYAYKAIKVKTKNHRIIELWKVSNERFPETDKLSEVVNAGFASPGAHLIHISKEYECLIQILKQWKTLNFDEQSRLLIDNPLGLCNMIDSFVGSQHQDRAIRHMFLYYCYPSYFERINRTDTKEKIYKAYSYLLENKNPCKEGVLCSMDDAIYKIRKCLEKRYGTNELDFYSGVYFNGEQIDLFSEWGLEENSSKTKEGNSVSNSEIYTTNSTNDEFIDDHPLNQILYGPPGTGKTWHTVNHAIAIVDGRAVEEVTRCNRKRNKKRFQELKAAGQIEMVTFHQSFTYEDFVEGIKPRFEDEQLTYDIIPGVFKKICEEANKHRGIKQEKLPFDLNNLIDEFSLYIQERRDEGNDVKLFGEKDNRNVTITGLNSRNSFILSNSSGRSLTRETIVEYYPNFLRGNRQIDPKRKSKSKYHGTQPYYVPFMERLKEFHDGEFKKRNQLESKENTVEESIRRNYVLIIDEINRGNVAKIFGELITLIEDTKRWGKLRKENRTSVFLPYSNDTFYVPDNVYIVGTMNTADRSIALLDTALRRRFKFIEMMPKPSHERISTNVEGINLQKLLAKMNERIVVLIDRDHQIGQTYFLDVKLFKDLKMTFQYSIIPLLQEYFYDNWEKIDLVLNRNGFVHGSKCTSNLFKKNELVDDEKIIYELLPKEVEDWDDPKKYREIYEDSGEIES